MTRISNSEKGKINLEKLRAYIKDTPLENIPKNQFGSASQKRILGELGIPTSNRDAEPIKNEFEKLDRKLGAEPIERSSFSSEEVRNLKKTISTLEARVAALKAENEMMQAQLQGEEWFLKTGRMIRP